jgi:lysophospholipase L1-like esterase
MMYFPRLAALAPLLALISCSAPADDGTSATGGGANGGSANGGNTNSSVSSGGALNGGAASGGGGNTSGGTVGSGGSNAAGGTTAAAGASAGGTANAGSASGGRSAGGSENGGRSAGGSASGGATASGGSNSAGNVGMGGMSVQGGAQNASGGSAGAGGGALGAVSVHIAGDSTVSTYTLDPKNPKSQAGWGQMLQPLYDSKAAVVNDAIGGRTARRFIQEGRLDAILKVLKAGDYLFVQFGTNDSNTTAMYELNGVTYPYYAAADTDFKTYIQQYIDGATAKKAIPVLVTPPPRNSAYCNGGRSLANYGQAMLDMGKAQGVAVVDLGLKAHTYLKAICPKPTSGDQESFFKVNTDNSIDGTHFQENGARMLARFVADGISEATLGLAAYRKP